MRKIRTDGDKNYMHFPKIMEFQFQSPWTQINLKAIFYGFKEMIIDDNAIEHKNIKSVLIHFKWLQ